MIRKIDIDIYFYFYSESNIFRLIEKRELIKITQGYYDRLIILPKFSPSKISQVIQTKNNSPCNTQIYLKSLHSLLQIIVERQIITKQ
ncbi:hypothetical protein pb186bvf_019060 [Paramecium bursaria]